MASRNVDNEQSLDLLLKCALCNGDLVNNQPKSLPCLHTFCTPCLTNERQRFVQDANIFKCPVCRSSEDSEITNNLELDVIIEKLLQVRHLQQSERNCEMCPEKGVSSHWCLDCAKFLCDLCLVHHGKYKPNDKIIDLSKGVDCEKVSDFILPTKCRRHKKKFKMYCSQCEICLCSTCLLEHISDKNANCALVAIEKVAPGTKSEGQKLLEETYSRLEEENQQIEGIKLKIIDLKNHCSEKGVEIWEDTEETVKRLKENARALIEELETSTKSEINELEKLVQLRQDHVKEIEILDNNFRQLLYYFDNVDILLNYARLKSKCKNLLMKPINDVPSHYVVLRMEYNIWYLKTREMSKTVPLGHWTDSELTEDSHPWGLMAPVPTLNHDRIDEFSLKREGDISCIFVTDESHVHVVYGKRGKWDVYNKANLCCGTQKYKLNQMDSCSDQCRLSSDEIWFVNGNLTLCQTNETSPFLKCLKDIKPDVEYCSICNCFGKILVCDYNCCVHSLNEDGTVHRTVLDIKRKPSPYNKIRCGPFKDTFLLFVDDGFKLFCYSFDGSKCLFSFGIGGLILDMCTDKYGNIYVVEQHEEKVHLLVFSPDTSEKHYLNADMIGTENYRIFVKDNVLYLATNLQMTKFYLYYHGRSRTIE